MNRKCLLAFALCALAAFAQESAKLHGIVHDPQHRPIEHAQVSVKSAAPGSFSAVVQANADGEFEVIAIPNGAYSISVTAKGFRPLEEPVTVVAGKTPIVHLQLEVATLSQQIEVSGAGGKLETQTSTVQVLVTPQDIAETPGATQTNSLAMITDYTPGAYMVHDMLHMRGGHQVNWFFDGIPIINTNIAANVAPLINPKNVEELEIERGGFSSEYGDRTYGFFNVVTPSGFEKNNDAELIASAGNFYSTDDQFDVGGHSARFAYYASVDGNRSELGLATPISQVIHDQESGEGGFLSLLYNPTPKDQLRWIASVRNDHYQIPSTNDLDLEKDYLGGFNWAHSFSDGVVFSLTPYFHYNSAQYLGTALNDNVRADYLGVRSVLQVEKKQHNARVGIETWAQRDNAFFGIPGILNQTSLHWANSESLFVEDQYKVTSWFSLDLGMRLQHYGGLVSENAFDPRVGGSIRIPKLRWVLHGYYAYYYQPPPLDSLAGPSLQFAVDQGYDFIPLKGERDIQHDIGLSIPFHGWFIDLDQFHTSGKNFLDHDVIGNSGIFIPLTDLGSIISGSEVTVRSPRLFKIAQLRLAYSNQTAQGIGPVTGGLLEFIPTGNFLLDHDQRNTATGVLSLKLPRNMWMTPAYQFGSGFLTANGPAHLPPHSTFDLSLGKKFGERLSVSLNATNIANTRYLLDNSNTFGGTHYINPRQIYAEVRYHFHL
jgi:outer membrane receptor protein involved in Fe transport